MPAQGGKDKRGRPTLSPRQSLEGGSQPATGLDSSLYRMLFGVKKSTRATEFVSCRKYPARGGGAAKKVQTDVYGGHCYLGCPVIFVDGFFSGLKTGGVSGGHAIPAKRGCRVVEGGRA